MRKEEIENPPTLLTLHPRQLPNLLLLQHAIPLQRLLHNRLLDCQIRFRMQPRLLAEFDLFRCQEVDVRDIFLGEREGRDAVEGSDLEFLIRQ